MAKLLRTKKSVKKDKEEFEVWGKRVKENNITGDRNRKSEGERW